MVPWSIIWVHSIETTHNKKGMHRPVGQTAGDQISAASGGCGGSWDGSEVPGREAGLADWLASSGVVGGWGSDLETFHKNKKSRNNMLIAVKTMFFATFITQKH